MPNQCHTFDQTTHLHGLFLHADSECIQLLFFSTEYARPARDARIIWAVVVDKSIAALAARRGDIQLLPRGDGDSTKSEATSSQASKNPLRAAQFACQPQPIPRPEPTTYPTTWSLAPTADVERS